MVTGSLLNCPVFLPNFLNTPPTQDKSAGSLNKDKSTDFRRLSDSDF